jgi:hypothetical protein
MTTDHIFRMLVRAGPIYSHIESLVLPPGWRPYIGPTGQKPGQVRKDWLCRKSRHSITPLVLTANTTPLGRNQSLVFWARILYLLQALIGLKYFACFSEKL